MAVNTYIVTFMTRYRYAGSSFSLYQEGEGLTYKTVIDRAGKLIRQGFGQLLGAGAEIPYCRVSMFGLDRDVDKITTQFYVMPPTGGDQPLGSEAIKGRSASPPDFSRTAMVIPLVANEFSNGRIFLRFVPDAITQNITGEPRSGAWNLGLTEFEAILTDATQGWKIQTRNPDGTFDRYPISFITKADGVPLIRVETFDDHSFVVDDEIRIIGVRDWPRINGTYTVRTTPDGHTFTIDNTTRMPALVLADQGRAQKIGFIYTQITELEEPFVGTRKGGRPFHVAVGRVSKK